MIDSLLITTVSNALVAGILAGFVALLSLRFRRASLLHALWIVVLVRLVAPAILPIPLLPAPTMVEVPVLMTAAESGAAVPIEKTPGPTLTLEVAALAAWFFGMAVIGLIAALRIRRMARIIRDASTAPIAVRQTAAAVADRFSITAPPVLLSNERIPPLLWAVGRKPCIVLPEALLESLSEEQIAALIAHEMAHLTRRDHWVRWLEMGVTIMCWWNPLAWLISRQLRRAEERSCDERVIATFPEKRRAYAESLITTLRFLSTATTTRVPAAAGMADLSEVQGRLTEIMKSQPNNLPKPVARWVLALVILATLVASPMLMARPGAEVDLPEVFNEHITLELEDASLKDVMQTFSKVTNVPFVTSGDTNATVTVSLDNTTVYEALTILTKINGIEWSINEGTVTVHAPLKDAQPMLVGTHDGKDVFRFTEGAFEEPVKIGGPAPVYPEEARRNRSMGLVILDVLIDTTGRAGDVIVKKSPDNLLSEAAIEAVELWSFQPAMRDGHPVAVRYNLTIKFNLQ